jgi:gamma-glutamylcyclotransferase (GGCT)/AIG2-like uncharacterized protein YtfP
LEKETVMSSYLFVYGTLRRTGEQLGKPVGPDRIRGRLYDLGGAPGYYPAPDQPEAWVVGELIEVEDHTFGFLDHYEGVDRGLYSREKVTTENGYQACVYQINKDFTIGTPLITSGDWFNV